METMMLMPQAVAATSSARRHAVSSYVHVPETFGALPTTAAAGHVCTWSSATNGNAIRQAKAFKALGTRRLGEMIST